MRSSHFLEDTLRVGQPAKYLPGDAPVLDDLVALKSEWLDPSHPVRHRAGIDDLDVSGDHVSITHCALDGEFARGSISVVFSTAEITTSISISMPPLMHGLCCVQSGVRIGSPSFTLPASGSLKLPDTIFFL